MILYYFLPHSSPSFPLDSIKKTLKTSLSKPRKTYKNWKYHYTSRELVSIAVKFCREYRVWTHVWSLDALIELQFTPVLSGQQLQATQATLKQPMTAICKSYSARNLWQSSRITSSLWNHPVESQSLNKRKDKLIPVPTAGDTAL
jgi:hypothetical protein